MAIFTSTKHYFTNHRQRTAQVKAEASWEAYKAARKAEQKALKDYLRNGVLFWDSPRKGTYRKQVNFA